MRLNLLSPASLGTAGFLLPSPVALTLALAAPVLVGMVRGEPCSRVPELLSWLLGTAPLSPWQLALVDDSKWAKSRLKV